MTVAEREAAPVDPWERWGWLMAAVWLVFLVFPVIDAMVTDRPWPVRVLALAAIALFAAVYVHGFVRAGRESWQGSGWVHGWPLLGLALLTGLAALAGAVQGPPALGMVIFVVAYAVFLTPLRVAVAAVVVAVLAMTALPLLTDRYDGTWYLVPVLVAVTFALGVTRVLEERGEAARELAEESSLVAERERVARDVHDVLGHSLTVVAAKAELAERLLAQDPARARAELLDIQSLTREALTEVRATVAGLRVTRLGDELEAARAALASAGIAAVVADDPAVVDPRHRLVLAWVLRESVTNVVRHSGAKRCEVELSRAGLVVRDDGRGRAGAPPGNGLRGVAERVRNVGGTLEVRDGADGRGTVLEVGWP